MKTSKKTARILSISLFSLGILLALILTFISLWPDLEASLFDASVWTEESLDTLKCPILITLADDASISASFTNPTDQTIQFRVRAHISHSRVTLMDEYSTMLKLEDGATEELSWPLETDNATFGRIILARVLTGRRPPLPARQKSCGVFVLFLDGIKGMQLYSILLVVSLLSIGAGAYWWYKNERPLTEKTRTLVKRVGWFTGIILIALLVSVMGMWGLGVILWIFGLLLVGAIIDSTVLHR